MGIKNINPLIKRYAANAFFTISIERLSGRRIAIDANNWMYTNMAIARKKIISKTDVTMEEPDASLIRREWFLSALNFILSWMTHNVTAVFVFDGINIPPEKDEIKAKRRDAKIATKAKIDALYQQLHANLLEQPANIVDELRKELRNYNVISNEDFELFKIVLKGIGVPCLQASGEAEQLCSSLCIDGRVAAVFSADTDNLPRDYDTTCLKYQRCREIFAYKSSETLIVNVGDEGSTGNSLDINKQAITMSRDYLEMAGISGQINKIVTVYQHIVSANDGHVEELNLAPVLRYVPPLPKVKFLTF